MSYGGDFPTLNPGDLEGGNTKQEKERSLIDVIKSENQRLQEENEMLKRCLFLTKKNSDMKIANILAQVVSLLDEKSAVPWTHPRVSSHDSDNPKDISRNRQVPEMFSAMAPTDNHQTNRQVPEMSSVTAPTENHHTDRQVSEMSSVTAQTENHRTNSFRPIVPERLQSFRPTSLLHPRQQQQQNFVDINSKNSLQVDPTYSNQGCQSSMLSVDQQNSHVIDTVVVDPASRHQCYQHSALPGGQGQLQDSYIPEKMKECRVPVNSYVETSMKDNEKPKSFRKVSSNRDQNVPSPFVENESWESMMKDDYAEEQMNEERKVDEETPGSAFNQQHMSEGYGTQGQDVNTTTTKACVGSPLATSTPLRNDVSHSKSDKNVCLLNRPVDQIIGIKPLVSEYHMKKLGQMRKNKRLIGEIAFQLDRRILEYVFALKDMEKSSNIQRKRRYYGYSTANIGQMIRKEATKSNGDLDHKKELEMRYRFDYVIRTLEKFGYNLEVHGEFSQDMVNKHGLMIGPPDSETVSKFGLDDPIVLRLLLRQMIKDDRELANALVLLDCLCLMQYDDRRPIFMW